MREVKTRRSVLQRLRGAGDIDVLHGAESLRLEDVPGVAAVADALHELMERSYEHATRVQQRLAGAMPGAVQAVPSDPGVLNDGREPEQERGFF